jgi:two-component system phosphate regulon sensor histidine kinase PhoR
MLPWLVSALLLLTAIAFFVAWRRATAAEAEAELAASRAEHAAQEALARVRRDSAQLDALDAAQPEPLLSLARDRTILRLNPAAQALFARPERAQAGQTLIVATRSVELDELAAHALAGGEDCDRQITLNGQPYRARAVPVGAAGEFGVVIALQDLGELQRLGRARRDFIANISHELRTPLTSIHLLLDGLLSGAARDPAANAALEKIAAEVHTLEQMAQELLDLAQIESGKALVRLVPTPVAALVSRTVERLAPQTAHKRQSVKVDVPPDLLALADAEQLSRALGNLLHNAIKFTPAEGAITLRASRREGDVLIEVADTGPGIRPEDLPRVFERFFRGDRARAGSGTGLGLAVAKHVIEAHGGRLWVESEGRPGRGAIFRFTLPSK